MAARAAAMVSMTRTGHRRQLTTIGFAPLAAWGREPSPATRPSDIIESGTAAGTTTRDEQM
jgi:hypothetical protein